MTEFQVGEIYTRKDIHDEYGGQRQGGISTPRSYPIIFLFSGESGEQYGYDDGFQSTDLFQYYGEGRFGDMKMERGNSAIASHHQHGKSLHLFQAIGGGKVRYKGEFHYEKHHWTEARDTDGALRQAVVFELRRA